MPNENKWTIVIISIGLHILFLGSVFDIYFRSPIIPSARHHAPNYTAAGGPAAKRLILFVADGLRAESLYAYPERAPYLAKVAEQLGAWGVSHTKVPTESRPGHVALIAGMFEDPSAITKGWQENPVDFDTVFNQSHKVWSWGSPDILPMFAKGAWNGQVDTETYDPALEKFFANQDISQLDTWVFDRVKAFFKDHVNDDKLRRSDKVILFLHLLGLDTNGHSNKPHSVEFEHNVKLVDQGVQSIVRLCEDFWRHDGRTSYLFTADHGMTDWGSHGAGMDHETQTPFLAWGAGLRRPQPADGRPGRIWPQFATTKSMDINQTDVAPLMAALIGANMPQHSVGQLPVSYLSLHANDKIEAMLANSLQIHEQYLAMKSKRTKSWLPSFFSSRPDPFGLNVSQVVERIVRLQSKAKYDGAMDLSQDLLRQSLSALFHYQRYHRLPLYVATSFTYVGFIIYLILVVFREFTSLLVIIVAGEKNVPYLGIFGAIYSTLITIGQDVPWYYFLYYFSPFLTWNLVLNLVLSSRIAPNQSKNFQDLMAFLVVAFMTIEALIWSFFDRRFLSIALLILMVAHVKSRPAPSSKAIVVTWFGLGLGLMAFSFQPSVGRGRAPMLVLLSSFLSTLCATICMSKLGIQTRTTRTLAVYLALSGFCVFMSGHEVWHQFITILSWILFITALPLALLINSKHLLLHRLLALSMALTTIYQLFSLTYESLFLTFLILTMLCWLVLEHRKQPWITTLDKMKVLRSPRMRNIIEKDDFLRALTFLSFTIVSFFGTGNIASLNSFDPRSIQTLVTTFSPFLMGGLLLLKVILPFFAVALFAFSVQYVTHMPQKALFLIVLIFSDIMGLHFFFLVTDQGSWLDIGTSLSHFVIIEGTVISLLFLFQLASFSMKVVTSAPDPLQSEDSFVDIIPE